jgi:Protein of unknown function (DUF 659)
MPKEKRSASCVLNRFVLEYPEDFNTDGTILYCKVCEVPVSVTKKFQVIQHLNTGKHSRMKLLKNSKTQQLLPTAFSTAGPKRSQFNEDLCKAFLSANVPLGKLKNEDFRLFLEKYTQNIIPEESTIRKNYVSHVYKEAINKIREKVGENNIWVSLDETTDEEQRYVANFVVGILGLEEEKDKSYLLTMEVLEVVNHSTIAAFFNNALQLLWPDSIKYDRVLLVCTDAARYMCKAMCGLQVLYPKMIHVTCLAHGLHRVAEYIRTNFSNVNMLISSVKKVFLKAPSRRRFFLRETKNRIPLPPSVIVTRWGTWIEAAIYYAENFEEIKKVVDSLDISDAECIGEAQKTLKAKKLREELIFIKTNFACISKTIERLETRGLKLNDSLELVASVKKSLSSLKNKSYSEKLELVLTKNKGLKTLINLNGVFSHSNAIPDELKEYSINELQKYQFVPIVSCDVERFFSEYKNVLTENRRKFLFENLMHHCIIKCNRFL